MSNPDLHTKVKRAFDRGIPTSVEGDYPDTIFTKNTKKGFIEIDKRDRKKFLKLYTITDATTGRGEVALFWLFNYKNYQQNGALPKTLRAIHQGGAKADLNIDGKNVEVKAYDKDFNKASKLGQFTGRDPKDPTSADNEAQKKMLVNIIKALFLIDNLLNNEADKMVDIGNFDIGDLKKAAIGMCDVRAELGEPSTRKVLKDIKLFDKLYIRLDALNKMFVNVGLGDCTKTIGGEEIAAKIIQKIITLVTDEKPGQNGYVANLNPKNFKSVTDSMKVDYIRISGEPNLAAIKTITEKARPGQSRTVRKVFFLENNLFLAFADVFPN